MPAAAAPDSRPSHGNSALVRRKSQKRPAAVAFDVAPPLTACGESDATRSLHVKDKVRLHWEGRDAVADVELHELQTCTQPPQLVVTGMEWRPLPQPATPAAVLRAAPSTGGEALLQTISVPGFRRVGSTGKGQAKGGSKSTLPAQPSDMQSAGSKEAAYLRHVPAVGSEDCFEDADYCCDEQDLAWLKQHHKASKSKEVTEAAVEQLLPLFDHRLHAAVVADPSLWLPVRSPQGVEPKLRPGDLYQQQQAIEDAGGSFPEQVVRAVHGHWVARRSACCAPLLLRLCFEQPWVRGSVPWQGTRPVEGDEPETEVHLPFGVRDFLAPKPATRTRHFELSEVEERLEGLRSDLESVRTLADVVLRRKRGTQRSVTAWRARLSQGLTDGELPEASPRDRPSSAGSVLEEGGEARELKLLLRSAARVGTGARALTQARFHDLDGHAEAAGQLPGDMTLGRVEKALTKWERKRLKAAGLARKKLLTGPKLPHQQKPLGPGAVQCAWCQQQVLKTIPCTACPSRVCFRCMQRRPGFGVRLWCRCIQGLPFTCPSCLKSGIIPPAPAASPFAGPAGQAHAEAAGSTAPHATYQATLAPTLAQAFKPVKPTRELGALQGTAWRPAQQATRRPRPQATLPRKPQESLPSKPQPTAPKASKRAAGSRADNGQVTPSGAAKEGPGTQSRQLRGGVAAKRQALQQSKPSKKQALPGGHGPSREDAPLDPADPATNRVGGMRRVLQRWPAKPLGVIEWVAECRHGPCMLDRAGRIAAFLNTHRACKPEWEALAQGAEEDAAGHLERIRHTFSFRRSDSTRPLGGSASPLAPGGLSSSRRPPAAARPAVTMAPAAAQGLTTPGGLTSGQRPVGARPGMATRRTGAAQPDGKEKLEAPAHALPHKKGSTAPARTRQDSRKGQPQGLVGLPEDVEEASAAERAFEAAESDAEQMEAEQLCEQAAPDSELVEVLDNESEDEEEEEEPGASGFSDQTRTLSSGRTMSKRYVVEELSEASHASVRGLSVGEEDEEGEEEEAEQQLPPPMDPKQHLQLPKRGAVAQKLRRKSPQEGKARARERDKGCSKCRYKGCKECGGNGAIVRKAGGVAKKGKAVAAGPAPKKQAAGTRRLTRSSDVVRGTRSRAQAAAARA